MSGAPLLDANNVNHGLLLPILRHCRDDQDRPLLGPPQSGRETEDFLRNAYLEIPAAAEALRQYWMPTIRTRPLIIADVEAHTGYFVSTGLCWTLLKNRRDI